MSEFGLQVPQPKGIPFSKVSSISGTPSSSHALSGPNTLSETSTLITKISPFEEIIHDTFGVKIKRGSDIIFSDDEDESKTNIIDEIRACAVRARPWTYLNRKWTGTEERQWLRTAQAKVQRLWDLYKTGNMPVNESQSTTNSTATDDSIDSFLQPPLATPQNDEPTDDEYDRYCRSPVATTDDLIKWWVNHKLEYPRLSQMALDLLSIPVTETECERLFSRYGYLITDRRNHLGVKSVEYGVFEGVGKAWSDGEILQ